MSEFNNSLPSTWQKTTLEEVALIEMGQSPEFRFYNDNAQGLPFFQGKAEFGEKYPKVRKWCSEPNKIAEAGDILVSIRAPVGPTNIAQTKSCIGRGLAAIRAYKPVNQLYIFYFFRHIESWLSEQGTGSTFAAISGQFLRQIEFVLAPSSEQTRIVEKLEELLSDLDAGVAELKAAQKKLVQYRQSLLKAAVEGALTAEWRKTNQPTETGAQLLERILKERRARWEAKQLAKFQEQSKPPPKDWQAKYPEPVKADIRDLTELPEGWVWASAEQICDFITKGTTPTKELDKNGEKTIPFLRVTNLTPNGTLDLSDKVFVSESTHSGFLARSKAYPGDILMNIVGPPLGQVSVVPSLFSEWNINQAIAVFRALDGVLSDFICFYLLSPVAQQWLKARAKTTAGQTNLTLEVCRNLPIPLPPESEQLEVVRFAHLGIGGVHEQSNLIQISIKQSAAQRKNILKAAFSGKLVPQDSNDEPASVLLERIRTERSESMKIVTKSQRVKKKQEATL